MGNTKCVLFLLLASIFVQAKTESYEYYANLVDQYLNDLPLERKDNVPNERKIDLRMPNVRPEKHDTYFCTSTNFPADHDTYIVGYEPHAEQHTAHHMLMFGCETPATQETFWNCGDMGLGVCGAGAEKIMYAWGKNAPKLKLPKDVGFQIGGKSKERNLVLQVHYGVVDQFLNNSQLTDNSGVTLVTTPKRPKNLAGILLLASDGLIPPKNKAVHLDTGCRYYQDRVIHPFAFRVHAHKLGSVISGYRIRNNKWTLLGKGDPQRPQAFYPMDNPVDVRKDDLLAARCTYNSMTRDSMTYIGATMKDEMCNFYMMFYYDPSASAKGDPEACGQLNENDLRASFPPDADKPLEGGHGEEMHMKRDLQDEEKPRRLVAQKGWPKGGASDGVLPVTVGQITGVATDKEGNVVIIHRGTRAWDQNTFDHDNRFQNPKAGPIEVSTVLWLKSTTGEIFQTWGANMFYLPHGLTLDHEDNLWITDVAMHQVFKFSPKGEELLKLGVELIPGSDNEHFCKPTDVAIDSRTGIFFVSDGYCNSRILQFDKKGEHIGTIEYNSNYGKDLPKPEGFSIPHSISLDEDNDRLYVADRENGRVIAFSSKSGKPLDVYRGFGGRVFALHYCPSQGALHVVNGNDGTTPVQGYTFLPTSERVVQTWRPASGFGQPHDVTSDKTCANVYVAEIGPNKIWKFSYQ